jgi:3-deoxy-D-manno-octulosonic acid kinase
VTPRLPSGYRLVDRRGERAFAWSGAVDWLQATLERDGTLAAWTAGQGSVAIDGGRGGTRSRTAPLAGPDGRSRWVCRHYRRGGWMAPVMRGDLYLRAGSLRPFRELDASTEARARGVRTPAVIAGAVYGAGPFYRADLITELVPDARTLADRLTSEPAERPASLRAAGRAVRALEQARVLHADLSAGNLLLAADGTTWVIDLDRCRVLPERGPAPVGRMRRRLERSLTKLSELAALPLSETDWATLRANYEDAP